MATGQVYNSGNLTNFTSQSNDVTSTWQNAGTIGSPLTCWGPGGQGYCGPQPMVAAWGEGSNVINFSYGLTDLHQIVNVSKALANSGSNLQVNGFNFSFMAKNGNGWDNGQQDYLSAYVKFYDNTNSKTLTGFNYDLNSKYNWTQFNYDETFASPYSLSKIGNVRYGFIGGDSNYWAGPYGPEVTGVNFSLKYSVDPCATNPLYSPSCSGYADAVAKLTPVAPIADATLPPPPPPSEAPPPPGSPPPLGSPPSNEPPQPGPPSPPGSPAAVGGPATQVATSQPPAATSQPAKVGEVSSSKSTVSMSTIMSILSTESSRVGAVEKSVVATAVSDATKASEQAQQQAESVAGSLTAQSVTSSMSQTAATTGTTSVSSMSQTNTVSNVTIQNTLNSSLGLRAPTQQNNSFEVASLNSSNQVSTMTSSFSISPIRNFVATEPEVPQVEAIKFGSRSTLSDYMNNTPMMQLQGIEQTQDGMVKRNVQPNEVAGAVDISNIATQPKGYDAYAQMTLIDASFYKVDSIYKNQTTVDNVRILRGLTGGSDRLHQEMVDQQYKGK